LQRAETPRGLGGGQCSQLALFLVESYRTGHVHVADSVAVGETECVLALDVFGHPPEAPAGLGFVAGIHQGDAPGFGVALVHLHCVLGHVEGHVRHVQEVVGEVLLDQVALVAAADHEIVNAVGGVDLHHMPKDRLAADLYHGLGLEVRFLGNARAEAAGEDDSFHRKVPGDIGEVGLGGEDSSIVGLCAKKTKPSVRAASSTLPPCYALARGQVLFNL